MSSVNVHSKRQFWLKLTIFSIFDQIEKMFSGKFCIRKIPLIILKPLICFESNTYLK